MRIGVLISIVVLALTYLSLALTDVRANGSRAGMDELLVAIDRADVKAIEDAVSKGADVNGGFGETTPLKRAVFNRREDIVKALIQLGADVNAVGPTGRTPLAVAMMRDDAAVARLLVASGANPVPDRP